MRRNNQRDKSATTVADPMTPSPDPNSNSEEALRASGKTLEACNQQITNVLERVSDGFVALDTAWRFTYVNRKGEEIFRRLQKNKGSVLGKVLWEEFPQTLGTAIEQNYRRAVQDQVTVEFETRLAPLNAWYNIRAYPSQDGLSIYLLDISRRKKFEAERNETEVALRASEQHFRAAFNQAAVGMVLTDLTGHLEEVNERFSEILGYSRAELLELSVMDLTFPADLPKTRENIKRLLAGEIKEFTYEKRFTRKDGNIVWALTSVTLLYDHEGRPNRCIGVLDDITRRKHAEDRIREDAEQLQLALAAGRLGTWRWDVPTDLVSFGSGTAEMFGLPPGTSITWEGLLELLHEQDRDRTKRAVEDALAGPSDYQAEYRVLEGNSFRWLAARGRGIFKSDGSVTGMIGVVQDVTERRTHEHLQSHLAAVVESSDDAIISLSLETQIITWNKGAENMFGYSAEEVIGESIHKLLPKDRQHEEDIILGRIIHGERVEHYETVRLRKDGSAIDVSLTVSPIYNEDKRLVGVSKISRDITERKLAEAAIREESRVLEILNETGRSIASQLDLRTIVQIVTDSSTRLSGAKFGAFFYNVLDEGGESYTLYALSGAPREAFEKFGQPRATPIFGPTFRGEGIIRLPDVTKDPRYGQWGPHHGMPKGHLPVRSYLAVPVVSRDGAVIGGLFFGHPDADVFTERTERLVAGVAAQAAIAIDNARLYDAAQHEIAQRKNIETALREAQQKLQSYAVDLETQVSERTAKLREKIGELEAFSYSVSHDMRSPLRAMQGYSDALLEDYGSSLDETGREYLNRIKRASSRMDLLIQDVLAYSRVAQGEVPLKPVDLEAIIRDIIQNYPTLQANREHISIETPLPRVIGHEAYLTQAASNILTNGVKFVSTVTVPDVKIGAEREGEFVRLYFRDNGIGIAPEHLGRVFQIFGRVYSEKQYEGTGIGLAIAKKAAERMGGSIGVDSELGKGSCFYLLLRPAE